MSRETRRLALAAMTAATLLGGLTSSAQAASATLNFDCDYPLIGLQPATATITTAFVPDSVVAGVPTAPFVVFSNISLGGNASEALDLVAAVSVEAEVTTKLQIGKASAKAVGPTGTVAAPLAPAPILLEAPQQTAPVTVKQPGKAAVTVTGLSLNATARSADGARIELPANGVDSDGDAGTFDVNCTLAAGQAAQLGTINVLPKGRA